MNFIILIFLSVIPLICDAQAPSQVTIDGQCAGSIISERWVITSASCGLSSAPITSVTSAAGFNYGVERVISHPNYKQNQPDSDIAMVKLNTAVGYGNGIQPITLDLEDAHDYRGLTVLSNGWPFSNSQAFQVVDDSFCSANGYNAYNLICTIPQAGQQFHCQVGIGSPVIWNNQLIGLEIGVYQCGNQAHMFTRVSRHSAWILNQIALYNNNQMYVG